MPNKTATKSVWILCHGCHNHKSFPIMPTTRDNLGKVSQRGGICILSYENKNEVIKELVKSGYKVCPEFREEG